MDPVNSPAPYQNDEIDLFELFESLWKEKVLIVAITLVITLASAAVSLSLPNVYKASISLYQTSDEANKILSGLYLNASNASNSVRVEDFVVFLKSTDTLNHLLNFPVVKESVADLSEEDALRKLNSAEVLKFESLKSKKNSDSYASYSLEFYADTPEKAEATLQEVVNWGVSEFGILQSKKYSSLRDVELARLKNVLSYSLETVKNSKEAEIIALKEEESVKTNKIRDELNAEIEKYRQELNDRIKDLKEALGIAKKLGIIEPADLALMAKANSVNPSSASVEVVSGSNNNPLYLRGVKLLEAEINELSSRPVDYVPSPKVRELKRQLVVGFNKRKIEALEARSDDSAFAKEILELQSAINRLQKEEYPRNLDFGFIRDEVIANSNRIKPKRSLIVVLSAVVGGMIAIMFVLIRNAVRNRKTVS